MTLPPDDEVSQGRVPVLLILGSSVFSTMSGIQMFIYASSLKRFKENLSFEKQVIKTVEIQGKRE